MRPRRSRPGRRPRGWPLGLTRLEDWFGPSGIVPPPDGGPGAGTPDLQDERLGGPVDLAWGDTAGLYCVVSNIGPADAPPAPAALKLQEPIALLAGVVYSTVEPVDIQDLATVSSQLVVPDSFIVADVNVGVEINHTYDSDLRVTLVAPDGTRVRLFDRVGGSGVGFYGTTLDDEADGPIDGGEAPFDGSYRPLVSLDVFDGTDAQGTWTLEIEDSAGGDTGTLTGWSLTFEEFSGGPLPDLVGAALTTQETTIAWGAQVAVAYALGNHGTGDAGAFAVRVVLSADAVIGPGDVVLADVPVEGLPAGATTSGTAVITLPGSPDAPPAEFVSSGRVFLGLLLDPDGEVAETREDNNANRGAGVDLVPLSVRAPGSIAGTVWVDADGDGVRGPGEPGRAGETVFLDRNRNDRRDPDEVTAVTGEDGGYVFADLQLGSYTVALEPRLREIPTFPAAAPESEPVFRSDFAAGPDGFTTSGPNDQWHLSGRTGGFYFGAGEEQDGGGQYAPDANGTLLSPVIDLAGTDEPALTFRHTLEAEDGYDFATVGVLVDGREVVLASTDRDSVAANTNAVDLTQTGSAVESVRLSLAGFAGRPIQVFFRFTSDGIVEFRGWFIEEVAVLPATGTRLGHRVDLAAAGAVTGADFGVRPQPESDLATERLWLTSDALAPGEPLTLEVGVVNRGEVFSGDAEARLYASLENVLRPVSEDHLPYFPQEEFDYYYPQIAAVHIPPLTPGEVYRTTVQVPPQTDDGSETYLLLAVDPLGRPDARADNDANQGAGIDLVRFAGVYREAEAEPNDSPAAAQAVRLRTQLAGAVADAGDADYFRVTVPSAGLYGLTVAADGPRLDPRVQLLTASGRLLAQSDDRTPSDPTAFVRLHLDAGPYVVRVSSEGGTAGGYRLTTTFDDASLPFTDIPIDGPMGSGDFNGDGRADLVTRGYLGGVGVLLGHGDGTFRRRPLTLTPHDADKVAVGRFNRDGIDDIITSAGEVFLSNGDGTFSPPVFVSLGPDAPVTALLAADLNADGLSDLMWSEANYDTETYAVELAVGQGEGRFGRPTRFELSSGPRDITAADLDSDGTLDLAFSQYSSPFPFGAISYSGQITVVRNTGNAFQPQTPIPVPVAGSLTAGDFTSDGVTDLIARGPAGSDQQPVLLAGRTDGTFSPPTVTSFGIPYLPYALIPTDLDGDALTDLAVSDGGDLVLLRNDGGRFQETDRRGGITAGFSSTILSADLNADGRSDFVTSTVGGALAVTLLRNNGEIVRLPDYKANYTPSGDLDGDGRTDVTAVGSYPADGDLLAGDLNRDGRTDVVAAGTPTTILFGQGNGTFAPTPAAAAGVRVAVSDLTDLNRDGRLDLVGSGRMGDDPSAAPGSGEDSALVVQLGLGDGRFDVPRAFPLALPPAHRPGLLRLADLNADGKTDVLIGSAEQISFFATVEGRITLLPGQGDGKFGPPTAYRLDRSPVSIDVSDLDGDRVPDVVVGSNAEPVGRPTTGTVTVFRGGPAGLTPAGSLDTPIRLNETKLADLNGDGFVDLVTVHIPFYNGEPASIVVRLGAGDGTFAREPLPFYRGPSPEEYPTALNLLDVNADGKLDLTFFLNRPASPGQDFESGPVIALGRGDGTVLRQVSLGSDYDSGRLLVTDVNADGRPDFLVVNDFTRDMSVFLSRARTVPAGGDGGRVAAIDLNGDGTADALALDAAGRVLVRVGFPDGRFAPPVVVNLDRRAADFAVLETPTGPAVVVASGDGTAALYRRVYGPAGEGEFAPGPPIPVGTLPARVLAADLNADRWTDFAVADTLGDALAVFVSNPDGSFARTTLRTGVAPTALRAADADGNGVPDLLALNQFSGDLDVFLNPAVYPNPAAYRFRATTGLVGVAAVGDEPAPRTADGPADFAIGDFDDRPGIDAVVVLREAREAVFLSGTGGGGFVNPGAGTVLLLGADPGAAAAADFDRDGRLDLAVLLRGEGAVGVWLGDGRGGFGPERWVAAGAGPTGLLVLDANADGRPDLRVGNAFGDLLTLFGRGDGTFAPERPPADVPIAVADLNGDRTADVVLANEATNEVRTLLRVPGQAAFTEAFRDAAPGELRNPGAVVTADLDGDGFQDLVVANTGANSVRVYLGTGPGTFGPPAEFAVGTAPAGVTVADVNADAVPDLVVPNEGSNDVSVLFGDRSGGGWTAAVGPRLSSGGAGPVAVTVQDQTGDGSADLVVFNRQSNDLAVLPAVGGGFFRDQDPTVLQLPGSGGGTAPPVFDPDDGMVVAPGGPGVVMVDPNSIGNPVRPLFPIGPGDSVVGLQVVQLENGVGGLIVTAASGLVALARETSAGPFELVATAFADRAGLLSAAAAVRSGDGFDVYVSHEGSSEPEVVSLVEGGVPFLPPPPPPSLPPPTTLPEETAINPLPGQPLAPVPTLTPGRGTDARLAQDLGEATDLTAGSAPGEAGAVTAEDAGTSGNGGSSVAPNQIGTAPPNGAAAVGEADVPADDPAPGWEGLLLDLDRLFREFFRPDEPPGRMPEALTPTGATAEGADELPEADTSRNVRNSPPSPTTPPADGPASADRQPEQSAGGVSPSVDGAIGTMPALVAVGKPADSGVDTTVAVRSFPGTRPMPAKGECVGPAASLEGGETVCGQAGAVPPDRSPEVVRARDLLTCLLLYVTWDRVRRVFRDRPRVEDEEVPQRRFPRRC